MEGGTADEAMGQAGGRIVGVLKDIGIIVVTEGGFQVASFWWFVTKGDDAAKAAATAARGAGEGAVGLKGVDFEDYIKKKMGGSGNFKAPNGRDIDGILPDGRWYEAKSAFNYLFQNGILDPKKWNEFTSQNSSASAESAKQGKPFVLLTNVTPPAEVVAWLAKRGIPWELVK
jgi:hypothetical protein